MNALWRLLLFVFLAAWVRGEEPVIPAKLPEADIRFLNQLLTVKPGMTEAEIRARFPTLGEKEEPAGQRPGTAHKIPEFALCGLKWHSEFRLIDGKLHEVRMWAMAMYPGLRMDDLQQAPREKMRAAGLQIAAWFQNRIGTVTERYVPNLDCPAGNPFGLRHTWLTKRRAVAVEFRKNASYSCLELTLADWKNWNGEQKAAYGNENSWPLPLPTAAQLREAASPVSQRQGSSP